MIPHSIKLVLFDMVGTIVKDCTKGMSAIVQSMIDAFAENEIAVSADDVKEQRGKEKRKAIENILRTHVKPDSSEFEALTTKVYERFLNGLRARIDDFTEVENITDVFHFLKKRSIYIGVGSGLPAEILETMVSNFGWEKANLVDYVRSGETIGIGRPDPKMVHDMMQQFAVTNPREVVKVGDTVVDILEGKNAGAWTVAILTGTQPESELRTANPDYILKSVKELPELFSETDDIKK